MKYLLFIAMVTNVFGAGTVERDGRHFFSQVVSGRKDDAASMEEAVDTMPSLVELLTGLTSSALSRLLTIETLENVVDALPMGTLYNRARNTNFSRLREDPSETSAFLAQVLLDALLGHCCSCHLLGNTTISKVTTTVTVTSITITTKQPICRPSL